MQEKSERRAQADRTAAMRAKLLAVGRALFAEKGFAATGTPEIVAAAGVTRGALYHHFADKTDLFRAVIEAEAAAVADAVRDAAGGADELAAGADAWFEAMALRGRVRLLLVEGPAALGPVEMARIDAAAGGAALREGLQAALTDADSDTVTAAADALSAAFDRAALRIADGADPRAYRAALDLILSRVATA